MDIIVDVFILKGGASFPFKSCESTVFTRRMRR